MESIIIIEKIETRGRKTVPMNDELKKARSIQKKYMEKLYKRKINTRECLICNFIYRSIKYTKCKKCRKIIEA